MPGGIHPPPEVIASWPRPNLVNPQRRPDSDWIIPIIFAGFALFAVAIRLFVRAKMQRQFNSDDYCIILGLLFTLAMTTCIILAMARYGFNMHVWDAVVSPSKLVKGRMMIWFIECFNLPGTGFTKISILLFVKRMTRRTMNYWLYWALCGTIVFVALTTLAFEISLFLECRPFNAFWNQVNIVWAVSHEYHCINEGKKLLIASIISVVQDFMVATIPLILISDLQLPLNKKIGVATVFGIGYIACGMGLARTIYTHKIFFETYDVTWQAAILVLWAQAELNIGIVIACAPALKVFFTEVGSKLSVYEISKKAKSLGKSSYDSSGRRSSRTFGNRSGSGRRPGLYTQELADIQVTHTIETRRGQWEGGEAESEEFIIPKDYWEGRKTASRSPV